jgi:hypothetical protein
VLVIFHGAALCGQLLGRSRQFTAVIRSNSRPCVGEQLRKISFFVLFSCLTSGVLPLFNRIFPYETQRDERVRGIEPPCAAWEAAILPLNYTREEIFDFRFAIADCNQNKFTLQIAVACAVLSASSRPRMSESADTADATAHGLEKSLPRNHVVCCRTGILVARATRPVRTEGPCDYA